MNIQELGSKCTGCLACMNVCSKDAISSVRDDEGGFVFPSIDREKCIDCKACVNVCPVYSPEKFSNCITSWYGRSKNEEYTRKSSSGGIFRVIADAILDDMGVVYGADFDFVEKRIVHRSTDEVSIDNLMRSKYSESYSGYLFREVRQNAKKGRKVLFCGTPCQVAGLRKFLKKDYENVVLVDFICGGAASPKCFTEHIQQIEKQYNSVSKAINFRDKTFGWKRFCLTVDFENDKQFKKLHYFDSYFTGFINGLLKRVSCFACPFANNHYSDITIADFWGYKKANIRLDSKGTSVVSAHTEKGKKIVDSILCETTLEEIDYQYVSYNYHERRTPDEKIKKRNEIFEMIQEYGFEQTAKTTYMKNSIIKILLSKFGIR